MSKAASSLVGDVLNVSEYRKSAEGVLTRSATSSPAITAVAPATVPTAEPTLPPASAPPATAAPAPSLKTYLDTVQGGTPAPPSASAPSAPTPAPTPAATALAAIAPGKSSREVLAELDTVLGVDDKKSNYLARDLFVPTPSSNSFPAVNGPPSVHDKPFLHAADSYLQAHYRHNTFDPRMQYDAQAGGSRAHAAVTSGTPIVIQAPSDRELAQRGPRAGSAPVASAPPAAMEFSLARAHPAPAPSRLYSQGGTGLVPPDHPQDIHRRHGTSAYPADPHRAVEIANAQHVRRPVESGAMDYLHDNRIAVLATEEGNKYVNPYQYSQQGAPSSSGATGYNPHYSERPQVSFAPASRHESPNRSTGYSESKGSPAAAFQSKNVIQVPSPTSITAPHERQAYLKQMRQLRVNLTAK